ncbi:MAG: SH3 domain-containing protein [Gemmatimonadota bacterium]|jgi:hypothetical protein
MRSHQNSAYPRPAGLLGLSAVALLISGLAGFALGYGPSTQEEVRYAASELRLREAPDPDAAVLLTLPRAAKVVVSSCDAGWCRVRYTAEAQAAARAVERTGYAAEAYLVRDRPTLSIQPAPVRSRSCCKVCRTGKACGNSCISRSYTCRKGAGCACNG